MTIRFTGDKTQDSNTPIPDADYFLTVTDAEEKKTADGKRDMIEMEMTVCVGPYENRHFKNWLVFIEAGSNGHGMTLHALHAFGLRHDGEISVGAEDFKGKTVKCAVTSEPYKGRVNNKIKEYYILSEDQMSAEGSAAASAPVEDPAGTAQEPEPTKPAPQPSAAAKAVFPPKAGKKLPWAK